jgi:hypothetical protein
MIPCRPRQIGKHRAVNKVFLHAAIGACAAVAVNACGAPVVSSNAPSSSPAADASVSSAPTEADNPPLCEAPRPAELVPFPFNKAATRRDLLVGAGGDPDRPGYTGGTASFYDVDAEILATLIEEKFIDPYERQNEAPAVWNIFRFLCTHPNVRAAGYVVSIDRPDYRTSIDDIYAPQIDAALRADAQQFCVDAEATFEGQLECFWD